MKVIAVDFDGCLCTNEFPNIGVPNYNVINSAKQEQADGAALILWTCRVGDRLTEAVRACESWGLHFDAVNENLPSLIEEFGGDTRKIFATEYWDDRAVETSRESCDEYYHRYPAMVSHYIPESWILEQLAEEAAELAQAALKLRRTLDDSTNPTPISRERATENLIEEMADVELCCEALAEADRRTSDKFKLKKIKREKAERWLLRLRDRERNPRRRNVL